MMPIQRVAGCPLPVACEGNSCPRVPASPRPRVSTVVPGFTLIEMLVVMGIIVLAMTLAIPSIRYLTGSKSEQAAQNTVAAILARTRSDAIGLQQPTGILFAIDNATDRVVVMEVQQATLSNGVVYLDLVPDRDNLLLPPGIRAWTIKDTFLPSSSFSDPFPGYRYLGFNDSTYAGSSTMDKLKLGGVILFDGQGNLLVGQYGFLWVSLTSASTPTQLAQAAFTTPPTSPGLWPVAAGAIYLRSQVGFALFDRETFQNQQRQLSSPPTNLDGNSSPGEANLDPWLDVNTTPLLVNRYNGTLTRAE
jgi:prepilin-type N-terminal cleavage/methylation domain-containing protein